QPELRDLERPRPGAVPVQIGAELLQDALLVRLGLHVDEVAYDDAADVPQAELPGDLPGRVQIRLQDRLLRILLPRVPAGVDVDGDERLRRLDDDVPAARSEE